MEFGTGNESRSKMSIKVICTGESHETIKGDFLREVYVVESHSNFLNLRSSHGKCNERWNSSLMIRGSKGSWSHHSDNHNPVVNALDETGIGE